MTSAALIALLAAGCSENLQTNPAFDGPYAAAVLQDGGPFEEPVGFVANTRSGLIVPIDLKNATLLSDIAGAPFMLPRSVATGDERQLTHVAVWTPSAEEVTLFATDIAFGQLIEAPYIIGMDGAPVLIEPTSSEVEFDDADGSGDLASLESLELFAGRTTTEDWELDYDGEQWWMTGSRSGRQGLPARTGEEFTTDENELRLTISGTATASDKLRFSTDSGLIEHDLGGQPLCLQHLTGTSLLLVGLWSSETEQGWLSLFDMASSTEIGQLPLPEGAQPWSFAEGDGVVFVADAKRAVAYMITLDTAAPAASLIEEIPTEGPLVDLAWVSDEEDGELLYSNLFVAQASANRVDVYDLLTGTWRDVNPYDDRVGGLDVRSPVIGMDVTPERIGMQEISIWGGQVKRKAVALSTLNGSIMMLEGDTGCQAQWLEGSYAYVDGSSSEYSFTNVGDSSNPTIFANDATGQSITTPTCGGVLLEEDWTLTYDGAEGNWIVEGDISGVQVNRAWEDQRYLSDDGALSFTLLAGSLPTTDGDIFTFRSQDNVLRISSISRPSGSTQPLELPAPPVIFQYTSGQTGGGWDKLQRRTYILQPVENTNAVLRIRMGTWDVEALWE